MPKRLLPSTSDLPIWDRTGIRVLEARLQSTTSAPLMDLAGLATARMAMAVAPHASRIWVAVGPGNNGGDGLEAAMNLHRRGLGVQISLFGDPEQLPADSRRALVRASQSGVHIEQGLPTSLLDLGPQDLCIDALLGIGATRAPQGQLLQAILRINASPAQVLAIDVPSGLDSDSGQVLGSCVQADHTLTLLGIKPGLLMGHGRDACGTLWLETLGLPDEATAWYPPNAQLNPRLANPPRHHASHKGSYGDVAIVGGESMGPHTAMSGAALLAAQAASHAGAGRVMLSLLGEDTHTLLPADLIRRDLETLDLPRLTVVAGCGGGQAIAHVLGRLIQHSARLVLDADALNRLAEDAWLQDLLIQRSDRRLPTVLTPHPLEAARLLGTDTAQVQNKRLESACHLALRFGCCVVLKGSGTVLAAPGQTPRINTTGNGLLAVGGTGDVLAGLTGALLARSGDAWHAACRAVWVHGQAADAWPAGHALTASRLARALQ